MVYIKNKRSQWLILGALIFTFSFSFLGSTADDEQSFQLSDLSWISGDWVEEKTEYKRIIKIHWGAQMDDAYVGTWSTSKEGEMDAYEMLTMRQTDEGIIYRYEYFSRKDGFIESQPSEFLLKEVKGHRAVFTSQADPKWILVMEITEEGSLRGMQVNSETGKTYIGYTAAKAGS